MINDNYITFHDIKVSLLELRVWIQEKEIHFTLTELRLLLAFLEHPDQVYSRDELVQRVDLTGASSLHVLIARLRLLLNYCYIETIRGGVGYVFTPHRKG